MFVVTALACHFRSTFLTLATSFPDLVTPELPSANFPHNSKLGYDLPSYHLRLTIFPPILMMLFTWNAVVVSARPLSIRMGRFCLCLCIRT